MPTAAGAVHVTYGMVTTHTKARVPALVALALLGTGCLRPTQPAVSALPALTRADLPFQVDSLRTQVVRDAVNHHFIYSPAGPWRIQVLDMRLDRCLTPIAVKGADGAVGRRTTSDLAREVARTRDVVGAVNADFFLFDPPGVPTGVHVASGRVVTPPARHPALAVDSAGVPHIVVLTIRNRDALPDSLRVDDPALARAVLAPFHPREAVGGRPVLARDSVIAAAVDAGPATGFARVRHPRTAVGIASDGRRLLLVVVDGRQPGRSAGMSLRELATLMLALGARDALNLDGGGSTAMVFADPAAGGALRVANRPSDAAGERAVGNALVVVRDCSRSIRD